MMKINSRFFQGNKPSLKFIVLGGTLLIFLFFQIFNSGIFLSQEKKQENRNQAINLVLEVHSNTSLEPEFQKILSEISRLEEKIDIIIISAESHLSRGSDIPFDIFGLGQQAAESGRFAVQMQAQQDIDRLTAERNSLIEEYEIAALKLTRKKIKKHKKYRLVKKYFPEIHSKEDTLDEILQGLSKPNRLTNNPLSSP